MTVYALGTSHTYGECEGIDDNKISNPWPSLLEREIGQEVINYGRPGANNIQLIEMAQHICENSQPDLIIAEMRWQPFPLLFENHHLTPEYITDNLFSATRYNDTDNDKYRYQYYQIQRAQLDKNYSIKNADWFNDYDTEKQRDIIGYAKINFLHNVMYNQHLIQSLSNMYHLSALCESYNVPVKVFVWAGIPFNVIQDANLNLSGLNTFEFFKSGKPFIIYAEQQKSRNWIEKHICKCGHMGGAVHEYFVETIFPEVKLLLTNKKN